VTLSGRFFNPGPVEIDADVAQAMLRPMIGHRGPEARALVGRLQPGLRALFGTERPVMLATGSATAMMEAAIRSGVRDTVLCVVSGIFGERFADIAERCDKQVIRLHVARGAVLEPDLLDKMLDGPPIDAVTMVHSETSTGALAPVDQLIARLRRLDDVVTIVDAVTSVGGMAVEADRWGADFVFTGSQKALGLPPGLAFAVASERFIERARSIDDRGFYLDVIDLLRAAQESRFPQTPALPVVYALETQLGRIAQEGLAARFTRHRTMRERVEAWVARHGRCGIMAPAGRRSDTVTALTLRPDLSATAVARTLAADGWQVAIGIEADEERLIRIGHMGDLRPEQLDQLLAKIEPLL
jgi:aspartate aminotransferase-like enzyme